MQEGKVREKERTPVVWFCLFVCFVSVCLFDFVLVYSCWIPVVIVGQRRQTEKNNRKGDGRREDPS